MRAQMSTAVQSPVRPRVLIVDDEAPVRFTLAEVLDEAGFEVVEAASGEEALTRLDGVEAVVTDLSMPGMGGLALLGRVRAESPLLPVLMLTARGSERVAVQALKAGAADYLTKPFDIEEIILCVRRAVDGLRARQRAHHLETERALGHPIIGDSPPMRRLLSATARIADREVSVLVSGETGAGKELIGALLHAQSRRASHPLVRFNCAAIPEALAESELFGHARGAFTGATSAHLGYFARAHGGTLVLDEVSELPMSVQSKLLRALQEREIQPVGGAIQRIDVRVIACANRDLTQLVQAGAFRADLYYRLAVVELRVPPLRERAEDIPALIHLFHRRYSERFGVDDVHFSPALVAAMSRMPWPGNVRELENHVARLLALSPGGVLGPDALYLTGAVSARAGQPSAAEPSIAAADAATRAADAATHAADAAVIPFRQQVESFERQLLQHALAACDGNQSLTARRLGLSRSTLIDKLKRHDLLESAAHAHPIIPVEK
jgi:DNA-binding NtrC family response regulator